MSENLDAVVATCVQQIIARTKRPLFVSVTGDSGSGKSYLTSLIKQGLEERGLSCNALNHDDFLISRVDREPMKTKYYTSGEFTGKSYWEILENMFRLDEFERVISELKTGQCVDYYPYSRGTGEVSTEPKRICPADINILDSSMMTEHMDFVILVDVSQENIIERKLQRDSDIRAPNEIMEMHRKVQGYYWQRAKPKVADIAIDNNDFANIHIVKS